MSFGFRVCFRSAAQGSLTSEAESIQFEARQLALTLKLGSATKGVSIGKTDRFSISGGSFNTVEEAQTVAEEIRVALLHRAIVTHRGIDLGQHTLKRFGITELRQTVPRTAVSGPCRLRGPPGDYGLSR
jgi:hypothetical protein